MSSERSEAPVSKPMGLLGPLGMIAAKLAAIEAECAELRSERDEEIQRVVRAGATERQAAEAAGVGAGYAHRAAVHGRNARRVRA